MSLSYREDVAASQADVVNRWVAPILLPIGPAAIALLRLLMPYDTADDPATIAAKVVADPGGQSLMLWLSLIGVLTLAPAVPLVARLTRRSAPALTAISVALLVPAYLSMGLMCAPDIFLWVGAQQGLDVATLTGLVETTHPTQDIALGIFIVGHVLGTIVLGVAMWRSGAVPVWAAVATIVSQPLHFFSAVIITSHPLDFVAWGLNAVGFAMAGLALRRR